ncbi:MAG: cation:dicarboxylase symporter family transporter [Bdellovibrionaceae bacterium]|nr:cation:dicarboxylase symporter family transporter [Pseudobdellovibrionaceae bacterium]
MFKRISSIKLTHWIFIALVIGVAVGVYFPGSIEYIKPFRSLFLNAIKCIIAPLIFSSIVVGINSAGNTKSLGRTGAKAIIYFEIATTAALFIGLFFVNVIRPGDGLTISHTVNETVAKVAETKLTFATFIEHLLPHNFVEAVAKGDVLQIVIFSCIFGVALMLAKEKGKPILAFCESLNHIMFKFTDLIMVLAPIGVGAATAASVAEHGIEVLQPMMKLVGTLYLALFAFVILVLWPALIYSRVKIKAFFQELRPTILLAFFTTSSESAYPAALESLEKMGVKNKIASFVLPLGYSFNLDGSTLYLAIASVFVAQAAGIELTLTTQITMMLTLMLTTKGVAAVPRASLVVLSGTLTAFGLPLEGIALILGVDEFMDMARTSVNLVGNCVATTVVSRWEGETLNPEFQRL